MNHNRNNRRLKHTLFSLFCLIILLSWLYNPAFCQEKAQELPRASIGIGALFGFDNANNIEGEKIEWKPGYGFGGGFVFESMLTGIFGLHSGIWYSRFNLKANIPDEDSDTITKHKIKSDIISMPLYLITSLSSRTIGFNLLTGLCFSYIMRSTMEPGSNGQSSENIQKYLGAGQIGAGVGFEVLFKMTRFTRIFICITGEYYFKNLIADSEGSIDHLYDATIRSGFMLCTF